MAPPQRADSSVRRAQPGDAAAMAEVQLETWRTAYAEVLPAATLDALDAAEFEATWRESVLAPPSPVFAVFVALHAGRLVGLVAVGPSADEDATEDRAEILELFVGPGFQQAGHASRLLTAAVDHLETSGFHEVVTWRFTADEASARFFRSSGWADDGSRRVLDAGAPVEQMRLHTAIGVSVTPLL